MHNYTGQRKRKVMMAERSNAYRDNSVITIQRDGVTTIFPLAELFPDPEFSNNINMSAKSVLLLLIRRRTFILDLRLLVVIEDT